MTRPARRRAIHPAAVVMLLVGLAPASADDAAWAALRAGGHVALVRHAATTGGAGDPPGFRLEDCATQRNLTAEGRVQARRIGERFRAEGIAVGKVLASEWCRCGETAELMQLGPVERAPTFNNAFALRGRADELSAGARDVIAAWNGPGTLVIVTHGANILPLTGINPVEGGFVVVKPDDASRTLRVLGQVTPGS
jgi:phosphohistidine phosphatase SixA